MIAVIGDISFVGLIVFIVLAIRSKKKETGRAKRMWIFATVFFVFLGICLAFDQGSSQNASSSTPKQKASISQKQTASIISKPIAQKKKESSKTQHPAVHLVSEQYLQGFLTFMDTFHSQLLEEMNNPSASQTEVAKLLTSNNGEGWKQYDYINSAEIDKSNLNQAQFDKKTDVLAAWDSLFQLDMDYNSYVMNDNNITSSTLNNDDNAFLSAYDKANSDFAKK